MIKEESNNCKNLNDVLEASTNIHNRLFNHKHFIDGEINYLINKTEKGECKDIDRLLEQIEHKNQIKSSLLNDCPNQMNIDKLKDFRMKAEQLLEKSNAILDLEKMSEESRKLQNNDYTRLLNEKTENIRSINQTKLDEVDKFFDRKKVEAAKYYHELESKWDV